MDALTTAEMLRQESAHYKANRKRWAFAIDLDSGAYYDVDGAARRIEDYLLKKPSAEADTYYRDRKATLDPDLLYSTLIGSIAGQLFGSESQGVIAWAAEGGEAGVLGTPDDQASRAHQLWHNIDGEGMNLAVWQRLLVRRLLCCEVVWVLVDGPTGEGGPVRWLIIEPTLVPDHTTRGTQVTSVKVRTEREERETVRDKPQGIVAYTVFDADRFEQYEHPADKGEEDAILVEEQPYAYYRTQRRRNRILPLFRVTLPFGGLGYLLARKAASIINRESERDGILRGANMPKAVHKKKPSGTPQDAGTTIASGGNFIEIDFEEDFFYTAPPSESAQLSTDVIRDKRANFFISAYQRYGDAARERTATEARQDDRSGREALLELLASVLDETLGQCLWLTEQVEAPDNPQAWGAAHVTRSGTFRPAEPEKEMEARRKRYLGDEPVPASPDVFAQVVLDQWRSDGWKVGDEEQAAEYLRRQARLAEMQRLTAAGVAQEQAAAMAGFAGADLQALLRQDTIPTNGQ